MAKYLILDPAVLRSAVASDGESPQEALKNVTAGVDLPTKVAIVEETDLCLFVVVEPGESQTPVVTRTRLPEPPASLNAYSPAQGELVVTWPPAECADAYVVYVDGAEDITTTALRAERAAPQPGNSVTIEVASKLKTATGRKSEAITFAVPVPEEPEQEPAPEEPAPEPAPEEPAPEPAPE